MKIIVLPAISSHHSFIYASYLRNRWFDKANKTTLKRSTWCALHHDRLERLLTANKVLVACPSDDQDTILGYGLIDADGPFTYVKLPFRGFNPSIVHLIQEKL